MAKQQINGIVLLDKPVGITSNAALQKVKHLLHAAKAGHTGSLDPNASGMLPICLGEATKFSQFLLEANKHYLVTGKLGAVTASGDSETPILKTREVDPELSVRQINHVLAEFRGEIDQIPPMYSALKYHGEPLYKLARQGIEINREPRAVQIFQLDLVEFNGDTLTLDIVCSKGTYVRTLLVDIGERLGCGAYALALRRLSVGDYRAEQMVTLEQLAQLVNAADASVEDLLLPISSMVDGFAEITVNSELLHYLRCGNAVWIPHAPTSGMVKIMDGRGVFCGVGEVLTDGKIAPRRLINLSR